MSGSLTVSSGFQVAQIFLNAMEQGIEEGDLSPRQLLDRIRDLRNLLSSTHKDVLDARSGDLLRTVYVGMDERGMFACWADEAKAQEEARASRFWGNANDGTVARYLTLKVRY